MCSTLFNYTLFALTFSFYAFSATSQTLIINEVSQGEFGNQEYVELVVVDNTVTYDCNSTQPPCIDIRGWIFDDNSGYHGSNGIAVGAVRFSYDNLWSCLPLGTIILLYNDADPNPLLPADDVSLNDGNCTVVAPISNTALFETNTTTPGAVACSYPTSGWTAGGDWNSTVFANSGDCARIVDLSGCEVFSVCWTSNNQNNQIYFSGGSTSANSASNTVYYFNGNDPAVQSNWSIGCSDISACGVENQTPGQPNNTANMAYIGQFNNNCLPITPIQTSAVTDFDASCICDGQATVSASGSIPGYTYEWCDSIFNPIGQTTPTATNLCPGTYNVITTSSIGCADTSQVSITGTNDISISVNSTSICAGETITLTGSPSASGGDFLWSPNGETTADITISPSATTTFTVSYSLGACSDTSQAIVVVHPLPSVIAGTDITLCEGEQATLVASGGSNYTWNNGVSNGTSFTPPLGTTLYSVTGTDPNGCSATDSLSITVNTSPTAAVSYTPTSGNAPLTVDFTNLSIGGNSYFWDFGNGETLNTSTPDNTSGVYEAGTYTVLLTASDGNCTSTWSGLIEVAFDENPVIEVPNVFTPNNDQINDVFAIHSKNLESLEGVILNRWGNEVFAFNTLNFEWDGTTNGNASSEGTYFIRYNAIGLDQKEYNGHTFFQLVR